MRRKQIFEKMRKIVVYPVENKVIDCPVYCPVTGDMKETTLSASNTI